MGGWYLSISVVDSITVLLVTESKDRFFPSFWLASSKPFLWGLWQACQSPPSYGAAKSSLEKSVHTFCPPPHSLPWQLQGCLGCNKFPIAFILAFQANQLQVSHGCIMLRYKIKPQNTLQVHTVL